MRSTVVHRRSWPISKVSSAVRQLSATLLTGLQDSSSPTFANILNGQVNLRDAVRRQVDFETGGKSYKLSEKPAVLIVR